ncbi:MAG: MFS transporter [Coxiellaceae bacterium]|nr:MFS transporter [Coxiellaceae bacterium]
MAKQKEFIAAISGTLLQWYDFSLFGFLAPVVAKTFFNTTSPFIAILNTFAVFAVGYLLAPIGAIFFGYLGDRHGRKVALTWSILLMTIPTTVIALLPGYAQWGTLSPIVLVACRLVQGFVASAEFAGSAIFMVEHAPVHRRCFYSSLTSSSYSVGMTLGAFVCSLLVAPSMPEWAWRLAFAFAALGAVLVLFLRSRVKETDSFLQHCKTAQAVKQGPLLQAFKHNKRGILCVLGLAWFVGVVTFGSFVYMNTYLVETTSLHLSTVIRYVTYALIFDAVVEPFMAMLADRYGKKNIIWMGSALMLVLLPGIFMMLHFNNGDFVLAALLILSFCIAVAFAPVNALMTLLFEPQYRFSGFATSFNVGISLFGGTAPLVLTAIVHHTHTVWGVVAYFALAIIVGMVALYASPSAVSADS